MNAAPVAIVGGGVAGLACALHLHEAGAAVRVFEAADQEVRFGPRLFACGDHRDMGSLHGALRSGRRAAQAVCTALGLAREAAVPFPRRRAAP